MHKNELVSAVAEASALTKTDTAAAIDATFKVIADALVAGGEVSVAGFGKFEARHRDSRVGRNPATGEAVNIAAKSVPHFSASKPLKDAMAESKKKKSPKAAPKAAPKVAPKATAAVKPAAKATPKETKKPAKKVGRK
jgi:DNA-binding protein HU-beta